MVQKRKKPLMGIFGERVGKLREKHEVKFIPWNHLAVSQSSMDVGGFFDHQENEHKWNLWDYQEILILFITI